MRCCHQTRQRTSSSRATGLTVGAGLARRRPHHRRRRHHLLVDRRGVFYHRFAVAMLTPTHSTPRSRVPSRSRVPPLLVCSAASGRVYPRQVAAVRRRLAWYASCLFSLWRQNASAASLSMVAALACAVANFVAATRARASGVIMIACALACTDPAARLAAAYEFAKKFPGYTSQNLSSSARQQPCPQPHVRH